MGSDKRSVPDPTDTKIESSNSNSSSSSTRLIVVHIFIKRLRNVFMLWLQDVGQFKCMLFRVTALLVTSKDADRRLLQYLCIAPVRLFEESVMESAVACWEWLLAARSDLRVQV